METKIIKIKNIIEDRNKILEAGNLLKQGGLVAFPTETVYGLGGDALDARAADKIYEAKGRPSDNPLIVHIASKEDVKEVAREISPLGDRVMEVFWPGPLTLIFRKQERVPKSTTGGLDTVAVRMPGHLLARELIRAGGGFIAAPSANLSGRPSPTKASHVEEDLNGRVDMILDGGDCEIGLESSILDLSVSPPILLRPGGITQDMIEAVIGPIQVSSQTKETTVAKAPGMKYRHYAPKGELTIVEGEEMQVVSMIVKKVKEVQRQGKKVGILASEETKSFYPKEFVKSVGTRRKEATIANQLFDVLRQFDQEEVDYIYSESFPEGKLGFAIMNRLLKAASHRVIELEKGREGE